METPPRHLSPRDVTRGVALIAACGLLAACAASRLPGFCSPARSVSPQAQATLDEQVARSKAEMEAWSAAERAEEAAYEAAKAATSDGSRVYRYWWRGGMDRGSRQLLLQVRPDGSGILSGSVPAPVSLGPADLAAFERAVQVAGFPVFSRVEDNICFDGVAGAFEASIGGRSAYAPTNNCGQFDTRLSVATEALIDLAESHGGLTAPRAPPLPMSPILWDCGAQTLPPRKGRQPAAA